jgi:hypothetical protein
MSEGILELKQRVCRLTGGLSDAFTAAAVALDTPPLTGRTPYSVAKNEGLCERTSDRLDWHLFDFLARNFGNAV